MTVAFGPSPTQDRAQAAQDGQMSPRLVPWTLSEQTMIGATRVVIGLAGLAPLWGFYDLSIRHWPPGGFLLAMGLVALGLALFCFVVAVTGPSRRVVIDPAARRITIHSKARFLPNTQRNIAFDQVLSVELIPQSSSDGPDKLDMRLVLRDQRRTVSLMTRRLSDSGDMPDLAQRLRDALA